MSKGVFLCVGTGGHVLPAYNVIKSMLNQGLDKKNILVVTDARGVEYFKDKDIEIIVYPFVSSQKGIGVYLLKLIKMLKNMGEKGKIAIRNIRREANEELKKKLRDKIISEDLSNNFEKNIQKLTDTSIENIEKILAVKEKEIIQI